jgi:hypothetical protein
VFPRILANPSLDDLLHFGRHNIAMYRLPGVRIAFLGVTTVLVLSRFACATSMDAASSQRSRAKPKTHVIVLTWDRVPVCLEASAPRRAVDNRSTSLGWTSNRREIPTAKGAVTLQLHDDEVALKIGDEAVTIGADEQGRPVHLSDSSLSVSGLPDCDAPEYVFITEKGDGRSPQGRRWLFDPRRIWQASESAVIDVPGPHTQDTLVSLRDGVLLISHGAAEGDEKMYRYHPDPVHAFVRTGAASKYVAVVSRANDDFYRDTVARETLLKTAGPEMFDLLRLRTAEGKVRLFRGRYLIVEGSAAGDFQRHGAVVVDTITDVAFFVLCDDGAIETGAILASSRGNITNVESGGEDVLGAFRFAGFNLTVDDAKLVCDGECHEERAVTPATISP